MDSRPHVQRCTKKVRAKKRTRTNGHKLQQYDAIRGSLLARATSTTVCTHMNLCACGRSQKSISLKPVPFLVITVAIVLRKLLHAKVKLDQAARIPLSTEIYFYLRSFTCLLLNAIMIFQF